MRLRMGKLFSSLLAAALVLGAAGCSGSSSSAPKDMKSKIEAAVAGVAEASGDAPVVEVRIHLDGSSYINVAKDGSLASYFWYPGDKSATDITSSEHELEFRTGVKLDDAQITQWANQIESGFSEECKGVVLRGLLTPKGQWFTESMCFDVDEDYDSVKWREKNTYLDNKPFELTYPEADLSKMGTFTDQLTQVLGSDEALVFRYGKLEAQPLGPIAVSVQLPPTPTLDGRSCEPEFKLMLPTAGSSGTPPTHATNFECRSQLDDSGLQPFHLGGVNWEKLYQSASQFQADESFFEIDSPSNPDQPLLRQMGALPIEVGSNS